MSRADIIAIVGRTSAEERVFLHAWLSSVARNADSKDGNEVSLDNARSLHDALAARGFVSAAHKRQYFTASRHSTGFAR